MKPSSASPSPTADTIPAAHSSSLPSARLSRPLGRAAMAGSADPALEGMLLRAMTEAREEARAAGYAAGWAEGRRKAALDAQAQVQAAQAQLAADRADVARRAQPMLNALAALARSTQQQHLPAWHEVSEVLADGVVQLAQAALDRELATMDAPAVEALRIALRNLNHPEQVTVRMHPADVDLLPADELPERMTVIADPTMEQGSILMATPTQLLELNLPQALRAALEVLAQ